jgi:hypothetical protein
LSLTLMIARRIGMRSIFASVDDAASVLPLVYGCRPKRSR